MGIKPKIDLIGQKIGRLTVLQPTEKRIARSVIWLCRCSCENNTLIEVSRTGLMSAKKNNGAGTKSCGCLRKEAIYKNGKKVGQFSKIIQQKKWDKQDKDMIGKSYGDLTVIQYAFTKPGTQYNQKYFLLKCICGKLIIRAKNVFRQCNVKSCGCLITRIRRAKIREGIHKIVPKKIGKITPIRKMKKRKRGCVVWLCKCDCGNETQITAYAIGRTLSCGCLLKEYNHDTRKVRKISKIVRKNQMSWDDAVEIAEMSQNINNI